MRHIIFAGLMMLGLAFTAAAQNVRPAEVNDDGRQVNIPQDVRLAVLRQLGLSPEQMQRIRRLNVARKPTMDEAQRRLRVATNALDEAIYADEVAETDVQTRLKDFQLAQAEVARLRFMNELAVRRILTKEQLVRFRELRRRFDARGANIRNGRALDARPVNSATRRPDL